MYLILRGSFIGADYPAHRFIRTPIRVLRALLVQVDYKDKLKANIYNASIAKALSVVIQQLHGLQQLQATEKIRAPEITAEDLLPFPKLRPPEDDNYTGLSDRTKRILDDLAKERRIPMHVWMKLRNPPEAAR